MTSFKLLERFEFYYLVPSRIYKVIRRKYQSPNRNNTTYPYDTCLYLNKFFHLARAKRVPELQHQASEKTALQLMEGLEW